MLPPFSRTRFVLVGAVLDTPSLLSSHQPLKLTTQSLQPFCFHIHAWNGGCTPGHKKELVSTTIMGDLGIPARSSIVETGMETNVSVDRPIR